jgi:ribonucleoside-diphosphate reductase beta chain
MSPRNSGSFDERGAFVKNTDVGGENATRSRIQLNIKTNEKHLIHRLVAFFATGDSIVANNLVLNLYKHINSPEARLYLSRQLYEEALHVQFYLTLLDTYIPHPDERAKAFAAVENIPSIKKKADFCFKWMDSINELNECSSSQLSPMFIS